MNWQDKMKIVIENVLNSDLGNPIYEVIILDNTTFVINASGKRFWQTQVRDHLESHWRQTAEEVLLLIFKKKIGEALSKV